MSVSPKLMYWNKCATFPVETDLVIMDRFVWYRDQSILLKRQDQSLSYYDMLKRISTYEILLCRYDE